LGNLKGREPPEDVLQTGGIFWRKPLLSEALERKGLSGKVIKRERGQYTPGWGTPQIWKTVYGRGKPRRFF